jgi:hypothetical protein
MANHGKTGYEPNRQKRKSALQIHSACPITLTKAWKTTSVLVLRVRLAGDTDGRRRSGVRFLSQSGFWFASPGR